MLWAIIAAAISGGIVYVGTRHRIKKLEALERALRWEMNTHVFPRLHALDGKGDTPPVRPEPVQIAPMPPAQRRYDDIARMMFIISVSCSVFSLIGLIALAIVR